MVDIHTHILPGMDDGSSSVEETIALLEEQKQQGVHRIMLTPHFYPDKEHPEKFLNRRQKAYEKIKGAVEGVELRLGAEVRFSQALTTMDLEPFAFEDSDYILIELSSRRIPYRLEEVFFYIQSQGYVPIIPHAERCAYFREDPQMLLKLIDNGVLCQANAEYVLDKSYKSFMKAALKHNFYQFVASDAHNMTTRPPYLQSGYTALEKLLGEEKRQAFQNNALSVWNNEEIDRPQPTPINKIFNKYI